MNKEDAVVEIRIAVNAKEDTSAKQVQDDLAKALNQFYDLLEVVLDVKGVADADISVQEMPLDKEVVEVDTNEGTMRLVADGDNASIAGGPFSPLTNIDDMMEGVITAVLAAYAAGVRDKERLQAIINTSLDSVANKV